MIILQNIRDQKKDLETRLALIYKDYITFIIYDWEEYYNQIIVTIEEKLRTLKPDEIDAIKERRSLIIYYRDEYEASSLDLNQELLSEEDYNNISRQLKDLNERVNAEERLKDLFEVEARYLNQFYASQDDNFDESDEDIIENLRILKPKFFSTKNVAEQIIQNAKATEGKQFFSTKTILLMYPRLFE